MSEKIKGLETRVQAAQSVEEKIDALNDLAWELGPLEPDRAMQLAEELTQLSISGIFSELPFLHGLAKSLLALSQVHVNNGNYALSISLLNRSLPVLIEAGDEIGQMRAHNEFGRIHFYLCDYPNAMQSYLKEIELAKKLGQVDIQISSSYNISLIHLYTENYTKAMQELRFNLESAKKADDLPNQAYILSAMSEISCKVKEYADGLNYGQECVRLGRICGDLGLVSYCLINVGDAYRGLGDPEQAGHYYQEALQLSRQLGGKHETAQALLAIGNLLFSQNQMLRALEIFDQSLDLAGEIGAKDQIAESHHSMALVFKQMGDLEQALEHYECFHELDKAIYNGKSDLKLKTLEVVHNVETARRESELYQVRSASLQKEIDERRKAQAALEKLANHDSLTGLFNRRHFFDVAAQEMDMAVQYNHPLAVIMMDMDYFKRVNDQLGHVVGDLALISAADLMRNNLRPRDIVCRYGGEEFTILLPEVDDKQAILVAERLREDIAGHPVAYENEKVKITISIGVACYTPGSGTNLDQLLSRADQALYQAKQRGRNRTVLYELR